MESEELNKIAEVEQQVETLETEVKKFANGLPYWAKYLAEKILLGNAISDNDIDTSYSFLLEELKLKEEAEKSEIKINYNSASTGNHKSDLLLTKLENVEGVNALSENQTIDFSSNLTIIYGANGSGKSGYVRLLKKAFYSKAEEDILPNVHLESGHKIVNAKFTFKSNKTDIPLLYSQKDNAEFEQFAVFDGKGVFKQLSEKNEFEFRPAGLSFFAEYTNAVIRVEQKLNSDIATKNSGNTADDLSALFDEESEIKTIVQNLNAQTNIDDLKKHTPFSDADKVEKEKIQKQNDELLLASKGKEKELKNFGAIKKQLAENKTSIENLNKYFEGGYLTKIKDAITDCVNKKATAKAEGIENFKTDKIEGIGTEEWKNFIVAAEAFAKKQKAENGVYPENGDNCILCQQPLSGEAENLITNYWQFIKSVAEENAKKAQETLAKVKQAFEKLNFDLFPKDNTLTVWLTEKYPNELEALKKKLSKQKALAQNIISDIQNNTANEREEKKISMVQHTNIEKAIDESIKVIKEDEQAKQLAKLLNAKTLLEHKEKFNTHFSKFETYVNNQVWLKKAAKANFAKRKITDTEKTLSDKYFNQKYIYVFNEECQKLNGNFGIDINHTGSAGKSYRQLKLKGTNPNAVLSEGEQKVIAIADFLAEMQLSEINKGIIFDDPVTSLDEKRKSEIAERLVNESLQKQVVVFTHDLVFVSSLIGHCKDLNIIYQCHWIENGDGNQPGTIWLNNTPSFEKGYKTSGKAQEYYTEAKKSPPEIREDKIKNGFAALRTSYETLVVFGLFNGVVQRFEERVSVDSLGTVIFNNELREKVLDSFYQCCRYMEGHSHSDKYSFKKPSLENLNEEIQRFNEINKEIKEKRKEINK
ncbi:AAA family ATPase [Leeuwenhoekiella palythoae]|uniref:AAA family ATPase n=1 Tax=Leeuwenhoekiella palythoae TaxID=573501 RepID=UPI001CE1A164|nr:AAA family ATPase [Leeuwenhoekiella palythoae]UBZ10714.1 AAA family ATPase [Leeuwenhoekiella palythoae]